MDSRRRLLIAESRISGQIVLEAQAHTKEREERMTQCDYSTYTGIASAAFAFFAAICWFFATWVGRGAFWRKPLVGDLNMSARLSARWNCIAALSAGFAALLQAYVTLALPVCAKIIDFRP